MPEQQRKRALPLITEQEVGRKIVPVIIGGTFLAYAYIREFHAKYGTTRCIVVLTQDVKMLTTSRFAECHIVEDAAHPEGLYRALEKIGRELHDEDPSLIPLLLGCDDRHALMFSAGKKRLEEAGTSFPAMILRSWIPSLKNAASMSSATSFPSRILKPGISAQAAKALKRFRSMLFLTPV